MVAAKKVKIIFRMFCFLILAALGAGLYFSNDIRNKIDDWENAGKNSAKIQLPEGLESNSPIVKPSPILSSEKEEPAPTTQRSPLLNASSSVSSSRNASPAANYEEANATLSASNSKAPKTNATAASPLVRAAGNPNNIINNNATSEAKSATSSIEAKKATSSEESLKPINSTSVVAESGEKVEVGGTMPIQYEDNIVSHFFINGFADFLVESYSPPKKGQDKGELLLTVRTVNLHYAAEPKSYFKKEKAEVLRYIMPGSMLEALYRIYVDDFVKAMQIKAKTEVRIIDGKKRALGPQEIRDMFGQYSRLASGMSALLEAFSASSVISDRLAEYYAACSTASEKNGVFLEATLDKAKALGLKDKQAILKTTAAVNVAAVDFEKSVKARDETKNSLISALHKYPGVKGLGDGNAIYCAAWINRRLNDGSANNSSIAVGSRIFANLAARFKKVAEK